MKKKLLSMVMAFGMAIFALQAQSTAESVYQLLQSKCVSCHNNATPAGSLDLEGSGATLQQQMTNVYVRLLNSNPTNQYALNKGYKYIEKGRADRSFLLRKINNGFEPIIELNEAEVDDIHTEEALEMSNEEKELLRQWILFGAAATGDVVDEQLISDFYNLNGLASFPDGRPAAPDPSEGFQIKMGPFYLQPNGQLNDELEFFLKHKLDMETDKEITRIDMKFPGFSHHFIIYNFNQGGDAGIPEGYRLDPDHNDISLVAAVQEAQDLRLPAKTAFRWRKDMVLDLNSHYINYSATNTLQAEVYVNIYTQPTGIAAQQMETALIIKDWIPIPNDGDMVTHTQHVTDNVGEVFVWGLMGHTHKYGQGYEVYKRLPGGQQGELIYDASCPRGIPGCPSPFFDYRHIPMLLFEPLLPITFNASNGIIHKASWINDGPAPVNFGPTSNDEMMVLVMMYTQDTVGLATNTLELFNPLDEISVFPNPMQDKTSVVLPLDIGAVDFRLYNAMGKEVQSREGITANSFEISRKDLPKGMYIFRIEDETGRIKSGKIVME